MNCKNIASLFLFYVFTDVVQSTSRLPNIIHIVADDLGYSLVDWHRTNKSQPSTPLTPNLNNLRKQGITLERHYAFQYCSPSRSALQSGRNPISVNVQNVVPEVSNPKDPIGGWQGIPTNMTGMASLLKKGGYVTRAVGKWDVGMATSSYHHPRARGFDSWTGYWHHSNDYWNHIEGPKCNGKSVADLWHYNDTFDGPATWFQNTPSCSQNNQTHTSTAPCVYEEELLADHVVSILNSHQKTDGNKPLFLYWAMHLVHMPLQVPNSYLEKYPENLYPNVHRQHMTAMVNYMDDEVGRVLQTLETNNMFNNTIITFHADNGGEIMGAGLCGGNNFPLTGGKFSNFEGGIRVNAFVSGGAIPLQRRGISVNALSTIWDWYATYSLGIAGVDPTDKMGEKAGLPPIDSFNIWPHLMGENTTLPRNEIIIGDTTAINPNADGKTRVGGVLRSDGWKLLIGPPDKFYTVQQYVMTSPNWPNSTSKLVPLLHPKTCGRNPKRGCLFNVFDDPSERLNHAETNQTLFLELLRRVDEIQKSTEVYSPIRGKPDPRACEDATSKYGGYWGPFAD
jgi:arylsulfatase B